MRLGELLPWKGRYWKVIEVLGGPQPSIIIQRCEETAGELKRLLAVEKRLEAEERHEHRGGKKGESTGTALVPGELVGSGDGDRPDAA